MGQTNPLTTQFDGRAEARVEPDKRLMDCRILVVDDSNLSRDIVGACLRGANYHNISFASDGHQALEAIDAQVPDLIILDLEMPVMDGFDLCRRLRQDESRKNLPVRAVAVRIAYAVLSRILRLQFFRIHQYSRPPEHRSHIPS